jgi:hypothetical protein
MNLKMLSRYGGKLMTTAVPDRWELELVIKEAGLLPDHNFFAAWRIPNDTAYDFATLADVGGTR